MKDPRRRFLIVFAGAWTGLSGMAVGQPMLRDFHEVIGLEWFQFDGMSRDTQVFLARGSGGNGEQCFRWTQAHGLENLCENMDPDLPNIQVIAESCSDDGTVVVGGAQDILSFASRAFSWNARTRWMQGLPGTELFTRSTAIAISGDGRVICGEAQIGPVENGVWNAFRYEARVTTLIPGMAHAICISHDGRVVVGYGPPSTSGAAMRWDGITLQVLGSFTPYGMDDSGSVVIGLSGGGAFRWTLARGQTQLLGGIRPDASWAQSVTADGLTVAGSYLIGTGSPVQYRRTACIWTGDGMLHDLNVLLPQLGVDLAGWRLDDCQISKDGSLLMGGGRIGGAPRDWVVRLRPGCFSDYDHDNDSGTDADIEAFFCCLGGDCSPTCYTSDLDGDGDAGTDRDIEAFFLVLSGNCC